MVGRAARARLFDQSVAGPGHSSTLLHINARACPATQDACKDLSCVPRSEMCPRCPISDTVRCGSARPIMNAETGTCHALDAVDMSNVACDPVAAAGYTIDVNQHTVVPLFNAEHQQTGLIEVMAASVPADGPQPCGESLTCVEVASCEARALKAAGKTQLQSHAVHIASNSALHKGAYLAMPTFGAGIGPVAADGYGHCLGMYNAHSGRWECVDEYVMGVLLASVFLTTDA